MVYKVHSFVVVGVWFSIITQFGSQAIGDVIYDLVPITSDCMQVFNEKRNGFLRHYLTVQQFHWTLPICVSSTTKDCAPDSSPSSTLKWAERRWAGYETSTEEMGWVRG